MNVGRLVSCGLRLTTGEMKEIVWWLILLVDLWFGLVSKLIISCEGGT